MARAESGCGKAQGPHNNGTGKIFLRPEGGATVQPPRLEVGIALRMSRAAVEKALCFCTLDV
jgi:hypothetical protein